MWNKFQGLFTNDIGIDLGTANTLVYVKDRGIVIREPSVVAIQEGTKRVLAVGEEAKRMLGRTPGNIVAIRPMKSGVIADFEITEKMIRYFINKVNSHKLRKPRVVIAVPGDITEVEKRAVKDSAERAGARDVYLIEEPMAAAIGVGLPVQEPAGNMIVDIGGGTTDVALISLAGIVYAKSVRVGGDEMDNVIVQYMRRVYNLMIGERTAEELKIKIGSAYPLPEEKVMDVKGRDLVAGLPKTLTISSEEIREALQEPVSQIVDSIRICLEKCPPELSADLVDRGMVLAGGGSLLTGIDRLIADTTGLPVHMADDPLTAVAEGKERLANVDDDGVWFRSHLNGDLHRFTPEISMRIQHELGADIIFAFDELTTLMNSRGYQEEALERTRLWAERCLVAHKELTEERADKPYQQLFGVIQGAQHEDLRRKAARDLGGMEIDGQRFDGFGIGGALEKENLATIVSWVNEELPEDRARHMLGISEPDDFFACIENGADTFDCVNPSRVARNAAIYSPDGRFNITRAEFKRDFSPLVEGCECYTCTHYSKAYIHHLFKACFSNCIC